MNASLGGCFMVTSKEQHLPNLRIRERVAIILFLLFEMTTFRMIITSLEIAELDTSQRYYFHGNIEEKLKKVLDCFHLSTVS